MRRRIKHWLAAVVVALWGLAAGVSTLGQAPAVRPPSLPPMRPPLPKSPVEQFRELLAASPEQREELLARKKKASADVIRANLKEFDSVSANERELLLRVLQLHQYLVPMLSMAPSERGPFMGTVPMEDRVLLEDRLKAWDGLPVEARQVLLADKRSLNYFIQLQRAPAAKRGEFMGTVPESDRQAFEEQFRRWLALPEDIRSKTTAEFQRFFELSSEEREKTLRRLSSVERRQMSETLQLFSSLPPEQRTRCLAAFRRFSGMTTEERAGFLSNATRWRELDPDERAAWRRLVWALSKPPSPPPLPSGRAEMVAGTNLPPSRLP